MVTGKSDERYQQFTPDKEVPEPCHVLHAKALDDIDWKEQLEREEL
jgi:hypothetical protein